MFKKQPAIDTVEIIEPPIQELTKRRHRFFGAFLTGGGCLVLFIILSVVAFRIAVGPGPIELETLPKNFPDSIPVYDRENINRITFISGKYKNRGVEIAALFPKIILGPLLKNTGTEERDAARPESKNPLKKLLDTLRQPLAQHEDSIEIEWRRLAAEPEFLDQYYKNELRKKNYRITIETKGNGIRQFSFTGPDGISGSFYASTETIKQKGTDYMVLSVTIPPSP